MWPAHQQPTPTNSTTIFFFPSRYPQNVRALLEDAAQALESGVLLSCAAAGGGAALSQAPPAWTNYWSPMKVLDLSRNDLEGIESLLVVETLAAGDADEGHGAQGIAAAATAAASDPSGGEEKGGGGGAGKKGSDAAAAAAAAARENRAFVYPLEQLEELMLNGNRLHGLPRDMDRVLPSLVRLELYGNRIKGIKAPERPLLRLKVPGPR